VFVTFSRSLFISDLVNYHHECGEEFAASRKKWSVCFSRSLFLSDLVNYHHECGDEFAASRKMLASLFPEAYFLVISLIIIMNVVMICGV